MKARHYINMMGMAAAVLLSSCVKDTLYDTPHPDKGAVTISLTGCSRHRREGGRHHRLAFYLPRPARSGNIPYGGL